MSLKINKNRSNIDNLELQETVEEFIDNINKKEPEVGAAMSWMYFLMVILIIGVVAGIMSMFVFYQRKD